MTFQQLRYFIATADYKSFSKAAESCYVAQTAISKQIANLEAELDCQLLARNKHQVQLTRSGEVFYRYAQEILHLCDNAVQGTKMAKMLEMTHLRIGYWGILEQRMLINLVKKYKRNREGQGFSPLYSSVDLNKVVPALLNQEQDVVLMPTSVVKDNPRIDYLPLAEPDICLAGGKDHPLAARREVEREELRRENFITSDTSGSAGLQQLRETYWEQLGFRPNMLLYAAETESALLMVETGGGVMLVTELMRQYSPKRLSFCTIKGFHATQEIGMAWLRENGSPSLREFLQFVRQEEKTGQIEL